MQRILFITLPVNDIPLITLKFKFSLILAVLLVKLRGYDSPPPTCITLKNRSELKFLPLTDLNTRL